MQYCFYFLAQNSKWVDNITQARIVKQEKIVAQTREQEGPEREL